MFGTFGLRLPVLGAVGLVVAAGCATNNDQIHYFRPQPIATVDGEPLDPVEPRQVTHLFREADAAYQAAAAAQSSGDRNEALAHYNRMLELLRQAEIDPGVFYSLRRDLDRIDDSTFETPRFGVHTDAGPYPSIEIPWPLPEPVLQEIERLQYGYPRSFQAGLDRSHKYLPYIHAELEAAGMPKELAYLPMVESMFTPKIDSRAGAGGLWQFMPATGRRYKLRQDSHVDERYCWQSSTGAAIAYLQYLNGFFDGDWNLALAAYNMGEGGLQRAIRRAYGERNYWKLAYPESGRSPLPNETRRYVPKFVAYLIVASNPERYGFHSNPLAPDEIEHVPVQGMFALDLLDEELGLESGTLARLNPELVRGVTPPSGGYSVAVPRQHAATMLATLRSMPDLTHGAKQHTVRRGETVSAIARRYGVSARELMAVNGIRSARALKAGQRLALPGYGTAEPEPPASERQRLEREIIAVAANPPTRGGGGTYTVKRGDTLSEIAVAQRVRLSDLRRWNNIPRSGHVQVGQKLVLADPNAPVSAPEPAYHTVARGDFPAKIASKYGVTLSSFLQANNLTSRSVIQPGQKLVIPAGGSAAPAEAAPTVYTVARGDTLSRIATRHGVRTSDLLEWNDLTSRSVIRPGQKVTIYTGATRLARAGSSESESPTIVTHTVARGQNPTTIARRYGVRVSDLFEWNDWKRGHVLHVGDTVTIRQ